MRGPFGAQDNGSGGGAEVRSLSRAYLTRVVAPARLESVLQGLQREGLLTGYRIGATTVELKGDFRALEAAFEVAAQGRIGGVHPESTHEQPADPIPVADQRADYYRACESFIGTASFYRLPPRNREIWRRHSRGQSHARIAQQLGVTLKVVRVAVRGARLAARLPPVASALGHGNGPGASRTPDHLRRRCSLEGCEAYAKARGLCLTHYLRAWRAGDLPEGTARETGA